MTLKVQHTVPWLVIVQGWVVQNNHYSSPTADQLFLAPCSPCALLTHMAYHRQIWAADTLVTGRGQLHPELIPVTSGTLTLQCTGKQKKSRNHDLWPIQTSENKQKHWLPYVFLEGNQRSLGIFFNGTLCIKLYCIGGSHDRNTLHNNRFYFFPNSRT